MSQTPTKGPCYYSPPDSQNIFTSEGDLLGRASTPVSALEITEALNSLLESREALRVALDELVKSNDDHNASVAAMMGTPVGWHGQYLNKARKALTLAKEGGPK